MDDQLTLCVWCEKPLPKKPIQDGDALLCGVSCQRDRAENEWPSWATGRIGPEPDHNWHMTGDFLCLSAPNRYRQMFRKRGDLDEKQKAIMELQRREFPHLSNPLGLDIDFPSWDQVLIWKGPTVAEATRSFNTSKSE